MRAASSWALLLHVVGDPVRAHQRALQRGLELAVLRERCLEPDHVLTQPLVLAQRLLVAVGGLEQERIHLGLLVPAHGRVELRLPHVERRRGGVAVGRRQPAASRRPASKSSVFDMSAPKYRRTDPHHGGAFLDGHLEIPAHAHRQLAKHRRGNTGRLPLRREGRAAGGTRVARLRACPARAAASSARRPWRRDMRPRPRRAAAPPRASRRIWSLPPRGPPESAGPVRVRCPRPPGPASGAARRCRPTESPRTPAPPFGPCSSAGGQADAT